jgi:hypothetical protein
MEVENYRYRTVLIIFNNFLPVERGALVDMSEEVATKTVLQYTCNLFSS